MDKNGIVSDKISQLADAKNLLKECEEFMNKVPNKKYGDNYKICSKINKFLNNK